MADQGSDQTIKQMMAGYTAMQFNLGLLPMQTSQSMPTAPMQAAPPPPMMQHPGEVAQQAMAAQHAMIQQTLQAAQMTRYLPPPSAPMPAVGAMVGFGAMNPFAAAAPPPPPMTFGGGGGFGGGGSGYTAPPRFSSPSTTPQLPSVFNPFATQLPMAHFASPSMRNLQMMHADTSSTIGTLAGVGQAGLGIGGSVIGGLLGGPLGALAGGWLGNKLGDTVFRSVQDMARARQIQAMTAPNMVSGAFLNTATGQGMNMHGAREVASGVRHLQRDYDFERTGFNTQDTLRIMQLSTDQGLIKGAMSPDQMVQKVKDISKTVKTLMRITGDPDVRDAIASLGQMRELGFNGLSAQAGAVANRAMFARMAGVSQNQMSQYGTMGADIAGQYGLAGATGAMAGMSGAAMANMAASSGAMNDLQMSRAGGKTGLASIHARAQLAAMNDERYLLAAMGRDAKGNMTVDMDAFRKAQRMSFDEVTKRSAEALRNMGPGGIFEWNTRHQEFKDQVAQKMTPFEMHANMLRQADAFMKKVPGMSLGTAIQQTTGLSAEDARALEVEGSSRSFYNAQIQQLEAQKRSAQDQDRASRERYRTAGVGTRIGRRVGNFFGDIGDAIASPFQRVSAHFERVAENDEAASRGQHIVRISDAAIAHDAGERQMMSDVARSASFQRAYKTHVGRSFIDGARNPLESVAGDLGRMSNRMTTYLGLTTQNDSNRLVSLASRSRGSFMGWHPLASFGDVQDAYNRVTDVAAAGDMSVAASSMTGAKRQAMVSSLGSGAEARLTNATANLTAKIRTLTADGSTSASALSRSDIREAWVNAHPPDEREKAAQQFDKNPNIGADMLSSIKAFGTVRMKEVITKAEETGEGLGAINFGRTRKGVKEYVDLNLGYGGLRGEDYKASDKTLARLGSVFANRTKEEIAVAAAHLAARSNDKVMSRKGDQALLELQKKLGDKYNDVYSKALTLGSESGDVQTALAHIAGTGTAAKILEHVEGAKRGLGGMKAGAAFDALSQTLGKYNPKVAGMNPVQAAKSLDLAQMDKLKDDSPDLYEQVKKMREGDDKTAGDALTAAAEMVAPSSTDARYGSRGGASQQSIERQITDIRQLRDKLAKDDKGDTASQLQAASVQLFSSSIDRFGKFVTQLTGDGEGTHLDESLPHNQAQYGDPK